MDSMKKEVPYITLGQFLKVNDYVSSGGEAKHLIHTFSIQVNGEDDNRRGRKLYPGDVVVVNGNSHIIE
ncbi:RNA-binding S4 domain-containing protein [Erysipelothrix inopinata]|uniref:RNA-binding S4 domain-containing protein n=1 Tax=Erysipelothrix inopinata TaxID=225084 RepID=A0A7G9S0F9_9FIRM|nr:RNA-binding S4 domain-containing protein [Erysipelothrix inopinata]QNN61334.1 RNA-binding S4 domain-containing protein [Erysipelothrix inopinata]